MSIFRGGLPYKPDVKRLEEAFPSTGLTEGRLLTHDELSAAIGVPAKSPRYYGVVNSWMKARLAENSQVLVWENKLGVRVLDPSGAHANAQFWTRTKARQLVKATDKFKLVDRERLSAQEQKRFDHNVGVIARLNAAVSTTRKELEFKSPTVEAGPKRLVSA